MFKGFISGETTDALFHVQGMMQTCLVLNKCDCASRISMRLREKLRSSPK
jgi:hypothetical protein